MHIQSFNAVSLILTRLSSDLMFIKVIILLYLYVLN